MKTKMAALFSVYFILTLMDPFSFDIPFKIMGVGPNLQALYVLFIVLFVHSYKYVSFGITEARIFKVLLVWLLWCTFEIFRGALSYSLTISFTEAKYYFMGPLFAIITYILLKHDFEVKKFFTSFLKPALWSVLVVFVFAVIFYVSTREYVLISLLPIISPSHFKNVDWTYDTDWIRFLNAYNASFLALVTCIFVILRYRFHYKQMINIFTLVLSFTAIAVGQVRTVWGVFGVIILISYGAIIFHSRIGKNIKILVSYVGFIIISLFITVYLNNEGIIDLSSSIKPFVAGFDQTHTFRWREIIWYRTLRNWQASPILGLGYGGYFPGPMGETVHAPHSSYISVLAKQGIIGIVFMGISFISLLFHFTSNYFKGKGENKQIGGIIGILTVVSMLVFAYSYEFTILQWIILGLAVFLTNSKIEGRIFATENA